jgi:DDE superfamily endonuclease
VYGNRYTILMDNATIHKTKIFKEYVEKNEISIVYNIPYNPIEMIFSPLKRYTKNHKTNSFESINNSVINYINNINKKSLKKMFRKALLVP